MSGNNNSGSNKNGKINRIRHRGMRKSHVQVTPDGKVIQHYKMDERSARVMRMLKAAQQKAAERKAAEEAEKAKEAPADVKNDEPEVVEAEVIE